MRLGRVEATGGFFLMLAWLNYLDRSFIVPMAAAACVAHELGHFFMIQLLKGEVKRIRLTAVGAEMVLGQPLGYWQEGMCALAGLEVVRLVRVREGSLPLGDLPRGRWRPLTEAERLQLLGRSS